jgi:hypothetical protein
MILVEQGRKIMVTPQNDKDVDEIIDQIKFMESNISFGE